MSEDVELRQSCRMPRKGMPVEVQLAAAGGIRITVSTHAALFVDCGRPAVFLQRLDAAVEEVRRAVLCRARAVHVGATAALVQHLKSARQLLRLIDCHVESAFDGNAGLLGEWRAMKRVQLRGTAVRQDRGVDAGAEAREPLQLVAAAWGSGAPGARRCASGVS